MRTTAALHSMVQQEISCLHLSPGVRSSRSIRTSKPHSISLCRSGPHIRSAVGSPFAWLMNIRGLLCPKGMAWVRQGVTRTLAKRVTKRPEISRSYDETRSVWKAQDDANWCVEVGHDRGADAAGDRAFTPRFTALPLHAIDRGRALARQ